MKKCMLSVLMALALWAGLTTTAAAADTGYTDVPASLRQ